MLIEDFYERRITGIHLNAETKIFNGNSSH